MFDFESAEQEDLSHGPSRPNVEGKYNLLVNYRSGDMWAPRIQATEALRLIAEEFVRYVEEGGKVVNDGTAGLKVVKMLVSASKSLKNKGEMIYL